MTFSRQEDFLTKGRGRQKQRTREDLLDAALGLVKEGRDPSIAEVAAAANVSTATAYRYFPNPQSLWADVAMRQLPGEGLTDDLPDDVEDRVDTVVRRVARLQFGEEAVWRSVLRATQERWFAQQSRPAEERVPVRGTARLEHTRTALAPLADLLSAERFDRLTMAVMLVYGLEAMVVTRDAGGLDEAAAADVMSWAARALVRAALTEPES
jgi:AcrR family transcriptional regulator